MSGYDVEHLNGEYCRSHRARLDDNHVPLVSLGSFNGGMIISLDRVSLFPYP